MWPSLNRDIHGYIHCIPYGNVLFGPTPNPPDSTNCSIVPFSCKLSPLHPGYVMTVCAEMKEERMRMHEDTSKSRDNDSIVVVL